jgi:soluble lytic murein transglycosylase-like protein
VREFDVDPALIAAVIQTESNAYARAVSTKGAQGLMQLMPETGREMGLVDPFDPEANIRAGTRYLKAQLARFATPEEALAAYNAGPGSVLKYGGVPPFAETRDFVRCVLGRWQQAFPSAASPTGTTDKAGTLSVYRSVDRTTNVLRVQR